MKAVRIHGFGGPDVLELADVPAPEPGPDEVVIAVRATSVNPVDWLVRDGKATSYVKVTFPVILGCDLAGEVVARGARVTRHAVGDEVFAMMPHDWGAHAERVALAAELVVHKPAKLSMIEAASLPVVAMTALNGLRNKGKLQRGERVLINGASGGVGLSAIQIAKALGAGKVTAVCSAAAAELVTRLGADEVIDYKTKDFRTSGQSWDLVFDCVGSAPHATCKPVLAGRKTHVTTTPVVSTFLRSFANPLFGIKVHGIITKGNGSDLELIKTMVDDGKLVPVIDKVFPFGEVAAAQEYSKTGRARGKIVLELARA
ncbi:MAG TPA: NAD(P)-dependent alcohol dehydrogenase [Kofleriaceae bacterium]|nr:NAD(P)-dependent alcohol dehydrogenase [Kofleriaceae bacterium]